LEGANPQLGPVVGRNWNRIYPGDRVTIPSHQAAALSGSLVVTRAPRGPAPPALVPLPRRPENATSFQDAQYRHLLASVRSTNRGRVAAWQEAVASKLRPWQAQLSARLRAIAGSPEAASLAENLGTPDLSASIQAAATTLDGLPGRRVLLLLDGGQGRPPSAAMPKGSLAGVHVVVANLADAATAAAWTSWARADGASATALDPALTQL